MTFVLHCHDPHTLETSGGKAFALYQALNAELPVPPWFTLTPSAYEASTSGAPSEEVRSAIATAIDSLRDGVDDRYAVRSSTGDEDGFQHSFAGQLESYLNVTADDVPARVTDVWRSGFSERVMAYRQERAVDSSSFASAVIVQRMVNADSAGVAFSADPVSGRRGVTVISCIRGLGEALVSGETDADTWEIDRFGQILNCAPTDPENPVLTSNEANAVAALARRSQVIFGSPQDIEWAIEDGRLWLLQSRPITTLHNLSDPDGLVRVWDNSNIAESYGGLTSPLTYTFARRAYEEVYRQFCVLMRVPSSVIGAHADTFRCMIGLLRGRVYYNLVSWHKVLALLPGYKMNREFMEQMMGVTEALPDGALPETPTPSVPERIRDAAMLLRSVVGLLWAHVSLPRQIRHFYTRLDGALSPPIPSLAEMRPDELSDHYRSLERQLLQRWDAPLVNDFLAMIFHGLLRSLCSKWCGANDDGLANTLIRDQAGMISTEPATRMKQLAQLARSNEQLLQALHDVDLGRVRRVAPDAFRDGLDAYLEKFGDRCLDELKLESATLYDDPSSLLQGIASIARLPERPAPPRSDEVPEVRGPIRTLVFKWVLRNARNRVRDRENLRFERTRLFGRVRRIFIELGQRYTVDGVLNEPRDIFWITLDEALGFVDGTTATTSLRQLAALRKQEYDDWKTRPVPSDRFETRGSVHHADDFQANDPITPLSADGNERQGLGCCPGIVEGFARVITDPRDAMIMPGEILVAERTDPGWVMLFPSAAGLLVERGSLLSHSAIVSRELGLPSIVSIAGLTAWLKSGDRVELDGTTGIVRKLDPDI